MWFITECKNINKAVGEDKVGVVSHKDVWFCRNNIYQTEADSVMIIHRDSQQWF